MASIDIYSFRIDANEGSRINGINLVNFLGSILDSNIVENINYDVLPDWVSDRLNDVDEILRILNFSYNNVDFCIICYTTPSLSSSVVRVDIFGKNAVGGIISRTIAYPGSASQNINFLIGQDIDYFLFHCRERDSIYLGVFRIDAPTNADDTTYISVFNGGSIRYTKPFRNENISDTAYLVSDMPYLGTTPYDSGFTKNFYNNKIPVYNVYAHSRTYGTRGKLTNLIVLPNSYSLSPFNFYMINGDKYCAFGTLGIQYAGTVLVRVK